MSINGEVIAMSVVGLAEGMGKAEASVSQRLIPHFVPDESDEYKKYEMHPVKPATAPGFQRSSAKTFLSYPVADL